MALYAVLPAPNSSPEEALAKMKAEDLFLAKEPTELDLRLPRLALASGGSMKAPLIGMGMGLAFSTTSADFAPMGLAGANISDVIHKVRMDVDEQGTVAAAATVVLMAPMGMPPVMQKRALLFDRPFALLLCDTTTGAILFAGVVYEP
jgi:serpin B